MRCICKNKTTGISGSRIRALTLVTPCRVGTPKGKNMKPLPFCSFCWREELQIRSLLWTKIAKQVAPLVVALGVSILGALASAPLKEGTRQRMCVSSFIMKLLFPGQPWTTYNLGNTPCLRFMNTPWQRFSMSLALLVISAPRATSLLRTIILGIIHPTCLNKFHSNSKNKSGVTKLWQ